MPLAMRKAVVVLAVLIGSVANVQAATTTTLTASPKSSVVGQKVTFTGKFTPQCAGTVQTSYFTIDGKRYLGTYSQVGQNSTGTYSTSTLAAGKHTVTYQWSVTGSCKGSATLSFTVSPKPSPVPTPTPSPSPLPSPSSSPVTLVADRPDSSPLVGYVGAGLILLTLVAGLALAVLGRR
jgi:hypothetical protein